MSKKKIKVKVKKRKINIKRIIICLVIIILIVSIGYYLSKMPIKNIYIAGNKILSDREIIELSGIEDYPPIIAITNKNIIKKIKDNIYIEDVQVKKKIGGKLYITIEEKKILCAYNEKLILEDGNIIENNHNITNYPILISDITSIQDLFISSFSLIEDEILLKISEIEYTPNDVDKERFTLKMNDGNMVFVTLNKVEKINKYNSIYSSLDGKKGIIYLDSGDYVEIKEE